ncbi:hypothetical protein [Burkholderia sp. BCC1047]|nr:hypothetical protein [Burkholderia sp. BCC1047]
MDNTQAPHVIPLRVDFPRHPFKATLGNLHLACRRSNVGRRVANPVRRRE